MRAGGTGLRFVAANPKLRPMHRYFFSLRIALLVVLAAILVASIDLYLNGFAVVSDPDRQLASAALVGGGGDRHEMREFAAGFWGARPERDAAIRVRCRTGREIAGGYASRGLRTTFTVEADDCAPVAGPDGSA